VNIKNCEAIWWSARSEVSGRRGALLSCVLEWLDVSTQNSVIEVQQVQTEQTDVHNEHKGVLALPSFSVGNERCDACDDRERECQRDGMSKARRPLHRADDALVVGVLECRDDGQHAREKAHEECERKWQHVVTHRECNESAAQCGDGQTDEEVLLELVHG
jgi:hypothetical protein